MPEWAEAIFAFGVTVLAVVAWRFGAAARHSPEGGSTAARAGRLTMHAGLAAGSTGAGAFVAGQEADGSLPAMGWAFLTVAALALTSGFALRLGAGWSTGETVSPARRAVRMGVTAMIVVGCAWFGNRSAAAHEPARVDGGRAESALPHEAAPRFDPTPSGHT